METRMNTYPAVFSWIRAAMVLSAVSLPGLLLSAGCSQVEGSRCNPALSHDECDNAPSVQCVAPTAAACYGEAYCCAVDSNGKITSTELNCQFLQQCQMAPTGDAGTEASSGSSSGSPEASSEGGE